MKMLKNTLTAAFICASDLIFMAQTPHNSFKADLLYPGGVDVDQATNLYYLNSVKYGTIGMVDARGIIRNFIKLRTLVPALA